jgi:hypothetical protein
MAGPPETPNTGSTTPTSNESYDENTNLEVSQTAKKPTNPKQGFFKKIKRCKEVSFSSLNWFEIGLLILEAHSRVSYQIEYYRSHFPWINTIVRRFFHHSS